MQLARQAATKDPSNASAQLILGRNLGAMERDDEAVVALKAGLAASESVQLYMNLAQSLHRREEYDEAEKVFRDALRMAPDDAMAHAGLGTTLNALERYVDALDPLETAKKIDPTCGLAFASLGLTYSRLGRLAEAAAALARADELNPGRRRGALHHRLALPAAEGQRARARDARGGRWS